MTRGRAIGRTKERDKPAVGLPGGFDFDLLDLAFGAAYVHAVDAGGGGEHRHLRYCTNVLFPAG